MGGSLDPSFFMSFEFQSTLVNVTPEYRIGGNQIGGVRIEYKGDVKVARLVVTNDRDIIFSLSPLFTAGDPDAIYAALSADLYEVTPGVLLNEGAIGKVVITAEKIIVDLEGSDLPFEFVPDAEATEAKETQDHLWALTPASFASLTAAAAVWRSSLDGSLEGLSNAITTEVADRIAAITAEEQRVDALIASGMWLFADQAAFPPAADNHGRVVHSHADGAIFYAHGGTWHQVAKEVDLQTTIDSVANEATARVAGDDALSARLDTLEADPTTATAVAAGDAATLSSANTYTDGEIATEASARTSADASLSNRLDVLEADPTTATAVAAVQSDVDANQTASESADSALSGRLDVLEADPTTQTAVDAKLDASAVSAYGLTLVDDADAATARTTLGLGTAATTASSDYATAAQGATADTAAQLDGSNIPGPYNNDTEAAAGGVAVGGIYKNSNGTIHWRVS